MINTVGFSNIEGICFVGDVHGEWATLGYKATEQYQLSNYLIVQLGDFGIGFHSEEYNKTELKKLNTKLKKRNVQLVALRGNHDDPKYFDGIYSKPYSNIHLIPDYTIINVTGETNILCVGGGLSIDRTERWKWDERKPEKKTYWEDELPIYDELKLDEINAEYPYNIDIVASHTAPQFVYPFTKDGIKYWMLRDVQLEDDLNLERNTMGKIYDRLESNQNIREWYYGHFHASKNMTVNTTKFILLDIGEFYNKKINNLKNTD
jgi:UDP-2,3-diacylglucosamine pyrophosphatase LpxH